MAIKINKYLYWTPRILGIIFVLFLMMFSLDVFDTGLTLDQTILALFIHNICPILPLLKRQDRSQSEGSLTTL
jgi:hypothetical protein